jgi:hypothetical protein
MKKVLLGIIIAVAAIAFVSVLVLGYLGFVPGVSNLFGSNKPVKLGTTFTKQDYQSAITKSGVQINNNLDTTYLDTNSKVYGPAKPVNFDLTPSEILALLAFKPQDPNLPMKDFDLRVNPDKSIEISSLLLVDKAGEYRNISNRVKTAVNDVNKTGLKEVPFYMKADMSVVNGQLNFNASDVKVGKLSVPAEQVNGAKGEISSFLVSIQQDVPGFSVKNASVIDGKIHFDGTLPSSVSKR